MTHPGIIIFDEDSKAKIENVFLLWKSTYDNLNYENYLERQERIVFIGDQIIDQTVIDWELDYFSRLYNAINRSLDTIGYDSKNTNTLNDVSNPWSLKIFKHFDEYTMSDALASRNYPILLARLLVNFKKDVLRIKNHLREERKKYTSKAKHIKSPKKTIKSIQWIDIVKNPERINYIHKQLKSQDYVDCSLTEFKNIFSGKEEFKRIEWKGLDHQLIYLHQILLNHKLIKVSKNKWEQLRLCFEYFTTEESSINTKIKNGEMPLNNQSFFDSLLP